jgi:hypothetical protein
MNSSSPEPDYEGFCMHLEEWDRNNVCYSLKDLAALAEQYHCPVPQTGRQRFQQLVTPPPDPQTSRPRER